MRLIPFAQRYFVHDDLLSQNDALEIAQSYQKLLAVKKTKEKSGKLVHIGRKHVFFKYANFVRLFVVNKPVVTLGLIVDILCTQDMLQLRTQGLSTLLCPAATKDVLSQREGTRSVDRAPGSRLNILVHIVILPFWVGSITIRISPEALSPSASFLCKLKDFQSSHERRVNKSSRGFLPVT